MNTEDLQKTNIDGEEVLLFKPNTIVYAVPTNSDLAKEIASADIGIVWHTEYVGGPTLADTRAKFGFNADIDDSLETIWSEGGLYSYLTSATVLKISSASTDDASAGTGARTITISGLDGSYNQISESVTLNGQTAVNTTNSFLRVFRMIVDTAGSGGQNAGKIYAGTGTVTSGVPANKYGVIDVGDNQTLMCFWTVPAGYTAYLHQIDISMKSLHGIFVLPAKDDDKEKS